MAVNLGKRECESCGDIKPLSSHFDKMVCSVCVSMRGSVKNKPLAVVKCLREFHGGLAKFLNTEERDNVLLLHGPGTVSVNTTPLVDQSEKIAGHNKVVEELSLARAEIDRLSGLVRNSGTEVFDISVKLEDYVADNRNLAAEISGLKNEKTMLTAKLEAASFHNPPETGNSVDKTKLTSIVMELLQSCIVKQSKVSQVILKKLRELAS